MGLGEVIRSIEKNWCGKEIESYQLRRIILNLILCWDKTTKTYPNIPNSSFDTCWHQRKKKQTHPTIFEMKQSSWALYVVKSGRIFSMKAWRMQSHLQRDTGLVGLLRFAKHFATAAPTIFSGDSFSDAFSCTSSTGAFRLERLLGAALEGALSTSASSSRGFLALALLLAFAFAFPLGTAFFLGLALAFAFPLGLALAFGFRPRLALAGFWPSAHSSPLAAACFRPSCWRRRSAWGKTPKLEKAPKLQPSIKGYIGHVATKPIDKKIDEPHKAKSTLQAWWQNLSWVPPLFDQNVQT